MKLSSFLPKWNIWWVSVLVLQALFLMPIIMDIQVKYPEWVFWSPLVIGFIPAAVYVLIDFLGFVWAATQTMLAFNLAGWYFIILVATKGTSSAYKMMHTLVHQSFVKHLKQNGWMVTAESLAKCILDEQP